jgi:hypothetical protein
VRTASATLMRTCPKISTFGAPNIARLSNNHVKGGCLLEDLGRKMEVALSAFDANLLTNTKVKITMRKRKRPYLP